MNINKTFIDSLKPVSKDMCYFDDQVKGFGVRIGKTSSSYILMYRNAFGQQKKITLCKINVMSPTEARNEAKRILALVVQGQDPQSDKIQKRSSMTVEELLEIYFERGVSHLKESTLLSYKIYANRHIVPLIGNKALASLQRIDFKNFYDDVRTGKTATKIKTNKPRGLARVTGGVTVANRSLAFISIVLNFAVTEEILKISPFQKIKKLPDQKRKIYLDEEGLKLMKQALEPLKTSNPLAHRAIYLLALTGCRKSEILSLRWKYIDFTRQVFRFPDTKTGAQNRVFGIGALRLLEDLKSDQNPNDLEDYVFKSGATHLKNVRKMMVEAFRDYPLLKGITPHVLRHTFASMAGSLGYSEIAIAGLLGHTLGGVTNRYTHTPDKLLIKTADEVSECIEKLLL